MSSEASGVITCTPTQAKASLMDAFESQLPVFLWGPPGIGKSEIVDEIGIELKGPVIDLRMAQMEPTDIRGIPFYNKDTGKMDWAPPVDLPDAEFAAQYPVVILFLDEMNSASPAVQAAGYQLILNRRVGKYKLPDNVVIVAAGNRDSDKGVTYRMPMPLANRFLHLEMAPDFPSWQAWAVDKGIHKDVVGYLSFAKADMYDFNARSSSRAFATPRSWCYVAKLLNKPNIEEASLARLVRGAIGDGLGVKFMAHRKVSAFMPHPADILSGKVKTLELNDISAMYSLTISMCYELKAAVDNKVNSKDFHLMADNFFEYIMANFETELVVMGARVALKTYKLPITPSELKQFDKFHAKYGKYIVDAGN